MHLQFYEVHEKLAINPWWQYILQVYNTNTDTLKGKEALKDRVLACGAVFYLTLCIKRFPAGPLMIVEVDALDE